MSGKVMSGSSRSVAGLTLKSLPLPTWLLLPAVLPLPLLLPAWLLFYVGYVSKTVL